MNHESNNYRQVMQNQVYCIENAAGDKLLDHRDLCFRDKKDIAYNLHYTANDYIFSSRALIKHTLQYIVHNMRSIRLPLSHRSWSTIQEGFRVKKVTLKFEIHG